MWKLCLIIVWVHAENGRVFARSNKYTFLELIHDSTNFIFGLYGIIHGFD